jgi:hypothetical protein
MSKPSFSAGQVLLFSKYHYGPHSNRTIVAQFAVLTGILLAVDIVGSLTRRGAGEQFAQEAMVSLACHAVEEYLGEAAPTALMRAFRESFNKPFPDLLAALLYPLTDLVMMSKDGSETYPIPPIQSKVTLALNAVQHVQEAT